MASGSTATTAAAFFRSYERFLEANSKKAEKAALRKVKGHLSKNAEWVFAGEPGLVSDSYGSFQGRGFIGSTLLALKDEIKIKSFKTQEIVDTAYTVDFTKADFLTPSASKVAVIAEQKSSTLCKESTHKGRDFRLDLVFYLDIEQNGQIKSVNASYDSYLMSEALAGGKKQVINPDIDDVITGKRDRSITSQETLGASLRFFGAFAGVQSVDDLDVLTNFVQPDTAVKFGGDPKILPFADKKIRVGGKAVVQTFTDQLLDSAPRVFDIEEIYVKDDRFIANTFEARTAVASGRNYDIPVSILFTATPDNGGRVASIEGIYDSSITTTAFTGQYPFPFAA